MWTSSLICDVELMSNISVTLHNQSKHEHQAEDEGAWCTKQSVQTEDISWNIEVHDSTNDSTVMLCGCWLQSTVVISYICKKSVQKNTSAPQSYSQLLFKKKNPSIVFL